MKPPNHQQRLRRHSSAEAPALVWRLNGRLFGGTIALLAMVGTLAYFWHAFQLQNTAQAFVQQAEQLDAKGEYSKAAEYLRRYLRLEPADKQVHLRLAKVYDKSAKTLRKKFRSVELYKQAMANFPKQTGLKLRTAELQLEIASVAWNPKERYADAIKQADDVLVVDPESADALRIRALSLSGQRSSTAESPITPDQVLQAYLKAREQKTNQADLQLSLRLALLYRNDQLALHDEKTTDPIPGERRVELADEVVETLLAAKPEDPDVLLGVYGYRRRFDLPDAERLLKKSLKIAPDDPAVLATAGGHALQTKSYDEAQKHFARLVELLPGAAASYLQLGIVRRAAGDWEKAIKVWKQGRDKATDNKDALNVVLAAELIARGMTDDADPVLDDLDQSVIRFKSSAGLSMAQGLAFSNQVNQLWAKSLLRQGDPAAAIPLLRRFVRTQYDAVQTDLSASQTYEAGMLLGAALMAIGRGDQAAITFENAAKLKPAQPAARLSAARAWASIGRHRSAIGDYDTALAMKDASAQPWAIEALTSLAQQHLRLQLSRPEKDWRAFNQTLAKAEAMSPDAWQITILKADYQAVQIAGVPAEVPAAGSPATGNPVGGSPSKAVAILLAGEKKYADQSGYWQRLVPAYERLARPADADRALAHLEKLDAKSSAVYLLRADLQTSRRQFDQARKTLREALRVLPKRRHSSIERLFVRIDFLAGKGDEANKKLIALHQANPKDVTLLQRLADRALEAGNLDDLEHWERKLRNVENVAWRYYKARRLLAQATRPSDPPLTPTDRQKMLAEVDRLQAYVNTNRPHWAAAKHLTGLLAASRRDLPAAIDAYKAAIKLGDRRLTVFRGLINLLYVSRRFSEAEQYLSMLGQNAPASEEFSSLAVSLATANNRPDLAIKRARQSVAARPKNAMARIWLAQSLMVSNKQQEAETEFKKAVDLARTDVRTWNALFSFYVRTGKQQLAATTLEQLAKNAQLTEASRAFVLAQGHESLGNRQQAEKHFRQAARLAPKSVVVQMKMATFLLQSDMAAAEAALRRVLQIDSRNARARRALASMLALRGGENSWQEALSLLKNTATEDSSSSADKRLRALLLIRRGGAKNRSIALDILEELVQGTADTVPGDHLLLARLYEQQQRITAATGQYNALVLRADPNPAHLATFVEFLMRHAKPDNAKLDDANVYLRKLEEKAPNSLQTIALRAQWLQASGKDDEIKPLVKKFADTALKKAKTDAQKIRLYLAIGRVYSASKQHTDSERWYRQLADLQPKAYGPLTASLLAQDNKDEAVRLCVDAAKKEQSVTSAITLAKVLATGTPTASQLSLADPVLALAIEKHKDNVELIDAVALLRTVQGRVDLAVPLYRKVVKLAPKRLLALNNLATLLAEQPAHRDEALAYVNRAIDIAGPQPGLLDTKGTLLLHQGRAGEAIVFLRDAASGASVDPRFLFHLALAQHELGKTNDAQEAIKKARDGGLVDQVLTDVDKKLLTKFDQTYPHSN